MIISGWNQFSEHEEVVNLPLENTYQRLLEYYRQSSRSFTLDKENFPKGFSFNRGNVLVSVFGLGSELWCKHFVDVNVRAIEDENTKIVWNINLKLLGLQAGKNAIIEVCKEIISKIA